MKHIWNEGRRHMLLSQISGSTTTLKMDMILEFRFAPFASNSPLPERFYRVEEHGEQ